MSFDYKYTCPSIDRTIFDFKEDLERYLTDTFDELCPIASGTEVAADWVEKNMEQFYSIAEAIFENVREINQDMRNAAEDQISQLKERVDDLEYEIKDLEDKLCG